MKYTRLLKFGCLPGDDVSYIKKKLFELGMYDKSVTSVSQKRFGTDTVRATKFFQERNYDKKGHRLEVDGKIGELTWWSIERQYAILITAKAPKTDTSPIELSEDNIGEPFRIPMNINAMAAELIAHDLANVSAVRRKIIMEALKYAYDPAMPVKSYPISLYIRGGNLYSKLDQETIFTVTPNVIIDGAKRQPEFYNGGRKEMMLKAIALSPDTTGADCSGGIIGLCHHFKVCKVGTDATANSLASFMYSKPIAYRDIIPGDWVHKDQHIGLYVGGGYDVEWMGGAYGCQLTRASGPRYGYNFVTGKVDKKDGFVHYRRPNFY